MPEQPAATAAAHEAAHNAGIDIGDTPTPEEAIRFLESVGTRFIRCNEKKVCVEPSGYLYQPSPSAETIIEHVGRGLNFAIEPRSLRCAVLDFDGDKALQPHESMEKCDRYCQFMLDRFLGREYLIGVFPSMSGVRVPCMDPTRLHKTCAARLAA